MRRTALWIAVVVAAVATLAAAAAVWAASSVTKHAHGFGTLRSGQTAAVRVPYPDALKYGNARYSQKVTVTAAPGGHGRKPDLAKVLILSAGSILGGSEFEVLAHDGNAAATAPVRVSVITTTVEPLPHS